MNKSDTLVILTPAFPANEQEDDWVPSQQLFVKKLALLYPQIKPIVLSFNYPKTTDTYSWNGISVIPFNGFARKKLSRFLVWTRVWQALNRIKKTSSLKGVLSFWCGETALVGKRFALRSGIPFRCWICGQDAKPDNRFVRFIKPQAVELVAMSEFLSGKFFESHGVRPAVIVPNAIEPGDFHPYAGGVRDIDLLAVGSFAVLKRTEIFVETVHKLSNDFPSIVAIHCGEGQGPGGDKEKIMKLVESYGLQQTIHFMGAQSHLKVLELMSRSRILLHPSAYEGFSTACLEAVYAGAHVISMCDPGGVPSGRWHIVQSAEAMKNKAAELLQSSDISHAPMLIHSMDDSVRQMMNLFKI